MNGFLTLHTFACVLLSTSGNSSHKFSADLTNWQATDKTKRRRKRKKKIFFDVLLCLQPLSLSNSFSLPPPSLCLLALSQSLSLPPFSLFLSISPSLCLPFYLCLLSFSLSLSVCLCLCPYLSCPHSLSHFHFSSIYIFALL